MSSPESHPLPSFFLLFLLPSLTSLPLSEMRVNSGFFGSSDLRSGRVVRFPSFWSHSELSQEGVVIGGRLLGLDFGWSYFPLVAPCTSVDV